MKEILFRGQTRKFGEKVNMAGEKLPGNWVYGGIFQGTGDFSIIYGWPSDADHNGSNIDKHVVYTDTVGQYTGLKCKNGKIFEGDYWIDEDNDIFVVEFRNGQFCYVIYGTCSVLMPYGYDEIGFGEIDCVPMTDYYSDRIEIIGNIHDNPELLKGGVVDE